jgi:hypothetical protein
LYSLYLSLVVMVIQSRALTKENLFEEQRLAREVSSMQDCTHYTNLTVHTNAAWVDSENSWIKLKSRESQRQLP